MLLSCALNILVLLALVFKGEGSGEKVYTNSWTVKIHGGKVVADMVAERNGFKNLGLVQGFQDIYHFRIIGLEKRNVESGGPYVSGLSSDKLVEYAQQQVRHQQEVKSYIPLDTNQWYLEKMKVEQAWLQGYTGCNVTVLIVDHGIEFQHPGLWPNFAPIVSYDHIDDVVKNPHGTRCAGVVGASRNSSCGVGIAHECNLGSVRIATTGGRTDLEEAVALMHSLGNVDIYSNSWGPLDSGDIVSGPGHITMFALKNGVTRVRQILIHVWRASVSQTSCQNIPYFDKYICARTALKEFLDTPFA